MSRFQETQWSLVLAAGDSTSPEFQQALATLCERYWYPVYAYVRRWGAQDDRAQDLTQGFFCRILEKRTLKAADRERGRFRSFLLAALKFYLADERDRERALKRGGDNQPLSLDLEGAEERYRLEGDPEESPDRLFERRWALEVLDSAHRRLHSEIRASRHPERTRLAEVLTNPSAPYRQLGEELDMSESAVKVAIHRLRQRFGRLLREEVAATVQDEQRVEEEVRHLLSVLAR